MKQVDLAKKINVTRQTLKNWEKSKPELIRLINLGLTADKQYLDFFELFPKGQFSFFYMNDFYIDFYLKFLNYFRQNITSSNNFHRKNNTDIGATFIYYLLENNQNNIFDKQLKVSEMELRKFMRPEFQKPLCSIHRELSEYILRNTLDDFETLIKDTMYKDSENDLLLYSVYIGINYLIYKLQPSLSFNKKSEICINTLKSFGIDPYNDKVKIEPENIYKKYLKFRKEYTKKHSNVIKNELNRYSTNDFYVPKYILELTQ